MVLPVLRGLILACPAHAIALVAIVHCHLGDALGLSLIVAVIIGHIFILIVFEAAEDLLDLGVDLIYVLNSVVI